MWILSIPIAISFHAAGKDYIPLVEAVITFTSGASSASHTTSCTGLTVVDDSILENTEFLSVTVSSFLTYVFIYSTMNSAYVNIVEDPNECMSELTSMSWIIFTFLDLTDITIGFASGTPSIATEGVDLTLQLCPIILNGSLEKDVYVSVSTKDITAKGQYYNAYYCLPHLYFISKPLWTMDVCQHNFYLDMARQLGMQCALL